MRKPRLPRRGLVAVAALALVGTGTGVTYAAGGFGNTPLADKYVGRQHDGSVLNSMNQFITPAGDTIEQPGRPMGLKVRPDGKTAVDLTWGGGGQFTVLDLVNHKVLQQYSAPKGTGSGTISLNGLLYSPDGSTLWAAQTSDLLRFSVAADGTLSNPTVINLPGVNGRIALPSGLAFTPSGQQILVTLNGNNTLGVLDAATGALLKQIPVGNAPRDVVVIRDQAYVSNQAGRPAMPGDFTTDSYGTHVVAEPVNGAAATGTVSQVDLATNTQVRTYPVGLQPTALLAKGTDLLVANSNDDSVSVIDTAKQRVGRTFSVNPLPGAPFGSSPNALTMLDGTHLVVSLGRDNALAVYDYNGPYQQASWQGLIPTGWYPSTVAYDPAIQRLVVAGQKGVGSLGAEQASTGAAGTPVKGHSVFSDIGTVSLVPTPDSKQIRDYTKQVFANNQWNGIGQRNQQGKGTAKPVAVPTRIGDPSTIKHVFVIVKENRTYDQVLGDLGKGNGDPALAQFGKTVTPNAHAMANQFPLIDNLYSDGTNSAEGHNWLDQAFANDMIEREAGNWTRSYPWDGADSLVYSKAGFIWDNALRHGLSVADWGEYANGTVGPDGKPQQGTWDQWYHDSQILEGKASGQPHWPVGVDKVTSFVPSLNKVLQPGFQHNDRGIPDQYRTDVFLQQFAQYEKNGNLPALNLMSFSNDHTEGTTPGARTPAAFVADNDLAVGRVVDAISHSKDWKSTAIFITEDDSQNGVDHVDGHRNPTFVISPYAKRGAIVHNYYSQLNITRTAEQILGLPPMNQLDLAAAPMYDAFTNKPDFTAYNAVPSQIDLTTANPKPDQLTGAAKAWAQWSSQQDYKTNDHVNEAQSNRDIWYSSNGFTKPYPGDSKVLLPDEVPGADRPQAPAPGRGDG
jgi:YVTN family beta-propeller protein